MLSQALEKDTVLKVTMQIPPSLLSPIVMMCVCLSISVYVLRIMCVCACVIVLLEYLHEIMAVSLVHFYGDNLINSSPRSIYTHGIKAIG